MTHRPARARWLRLLAAFAALAMVAAACGSRASKTQIAEAVRGSGGGGGGGGGTGSESNSASATGGISQGGTGGGSAVQGTGAVSPVGGGTTGSGGGTTGGAGAAAPAGGNGGATDVGVTADSITLANISILTGPVPGLFAGAANGTDAFFAYQNSLGGVYGRQLKLAVGDDQFDCSRNKALTQQYVPKVFALVGSFSLYDNCGASVINATPNFPDVHAALALDAQKEPNGFSPQPIRQGAASGPFTWIKAKYPDAVGAVGSLVGDVQSARDSWVGIKSAMEKVGYHVTYLRLYEPTESNFTADIVRMRSAGVKMLVLVAADVKAIARIEGARLQQGWTPEVRLFGASGYDPTLVLLAGGPKALEGDYLYLGEQLFLGTDRAASKEVDLFLTWLKNTHGNANPDLFTVFGWTAARLFVQALIESGKSTGGKITRPGVIAALKGIKNFDSNGLLAPDDPADKTPPHCYVMAQVKGGKFVRVDPASGFRCDGSYLFL
ncbi:MAG: hypothetical protein E6G17_07860 [Actinobacteria bacterium]|nr:MAG: hypothetical protein E6G17_07860 [Actinomycetota bacterium]